MHQSKDWYAAGTAAAQQQGGKVAGAYLPAVPMWLSTVHCCQSLEEKYFLTLDTLLLIKIELQFYVIDVTSTSHIAF